MRPISAVHVGHGRCKLLGFVLFCILLGRLWQIALLEAPGTDGCVAKVLEDACTTEAKLAQQEHQARLTVVPQQVSLSIPPATPTQAVEQTANRLHQECCAVKCSYGANHGNNVATALYQYATGSTSAAMPAHSMAGGQSLPPPEAAATQIDASHMSQSVLSPQAAAVNYPLAWGFPNDERGVETKLRCLLLQALSCGDARSSAMMMRGNDRLQSLCLSLFPTERPWPLDSCCVSPCRNGSCQLQWEPQVSPPLFSLWCVRQSGHGSHRRLSASMRDSKDLGALPTPLIWGIES